MSGIWIDMSIIQIMVTTIIVTIIVTLTLGVASYVAYYLRRRRRPAKLETGSTAPRFFYQYAPAAAGQAKHSRGPSAVKPTAG